MPRLDGIKLFLQFVSNMFYSSQLRRLAHVVLVVEFGEQHVFESAPHAHGQHLGPFEDASWMHGIACTYMTKCVAQDTDVDGVSSRASVEQTKLNVALVV